MIENQYNYNYVKIDDGDNFTILNNKVNINSSTVQNNSFF